MRDDKEGYWVKCKNCKINIYEYDPEAADFEYCAICEIAVCEDCMARECQDHGMTICIDCVAEECPDCQDEREN